MNECRWIRSPQNDTAIIFVHGILSSGDTCWRNKNNDAYWPELLSTSSEPEVSSAGICVFTYPSSPTSGHYRIGDAVELLWSLLKLDKLLDLRNLIFICHSMGGIVVRQLICTRQLEFIGKNLGLFLVASPSLGSKYANWLTSIIETVGNLQAEALRFDADNAWLNDLDRTFTNLKESDHLHIYGQEIIEDKFPKLPFLMKDAIVAEFSGARYFKDALKIPGSDHSSIAKPADASALQNRVLVKFISDFMHWASAQIEAEPAAVPWIKLHLVEPVAEDKTLEFTEPYVSVGRSNKSSFVLNDTKVSWDHGVFAVEQGVAIYRQVGSSNPTRVAGRGRQVILTAGQELPLVNQDRVTLGSTTLVVEFKLSSDEGYKPTVKADES